MLRQISSFIRQTVWLNRRVIAIALLAKLLILAFGIQAWMIINNEPVKQPYFLLEIWKRWDAISYLHIAQNGYAATGEDRFLIVFFPLYPLLIWLVSIVVRDAIAGALIVSGVASVVLAVVFRELVRLDYSEKTATVAVMFLFVFPTSFVLHVPYTESLFLALTVGCFLAARTKRWEIVGILGAAACLTRINGLILCLALMGEIWGEYRQTKRFNKHWLWLVVIPMGFAGYLGLNYIVTGDPTKFLQYQREHWQKYLAFPGNGISETIKAIYWRAPSDAQMIGFQELLFILIGLFAIIAGWRYLRTSYRVWMVFNWLLFISTNFILSVPRYTLVLFPIFILMALAARRWIVKVLFMIWSILYLALFTLQYARGSWAF